jgi:hypothetical protein
MLARADVRPLRGVDEELKASPMRDTIYHSAHYHKRTERSRREFQ